jgi:tetratricopeptide (TPR) repeat protein
MLIEDQIIYEEGGQWWVDEERLEELRVPPTLTGVLQARLDRLSEEERQILQRAAVIGRNFWGATIDYLLVDRESLLDQSKIILARLSQRKFIRLLYKNGNGNGAGRRQKQLADAIPSLREYAFQHPLLQEVTYNSILKANRRIYHRQIADWFLNQKESGGIDAYAAMIARHFDRAGDNEQAAKWYGQAAEFARNGYVYQEALENYERALKLLPPEIAAPQRIHLYDGLGLMLVTQARYDEALRTYQIMLAEADVTDNLDAQATAWLRLAYVYFYIGNHHKTLSSTNRAEKLIRVLNPVQPASLARALSRKCSALLYLGRVTESLQAGQESLEIARQTDDQKLIAFILGTIYLCYKALGNHKEAERYVKEGLVIEERLGDLAGAARSINSLGELARLQGDFRQAASFYHRAYLTLEEIGDISYAMLVLSNLGGIMVAAEDYAASLVPLEEVIARMGKRWLALPETYRFLAEAYLGLGNGTEALEAIRVSLKLGRLQDNPEFTGHAWRVLGKVASQLDWPVPVVAQEQGTLFSAEECFKKSIAIFKQAEMGRDLAFAYWDWGIHAKAKGDLAFAFEKWQLARDLFLELGFPIFVKQMNAVLQTSTDTPAPHPL